MAKTKSLDELAHDILGMRGKIYKLSDPNILGEEHAQTYEYFSTILPDRKEFASKLGHYMKNLPPGALIAPDAAAESKVAEALHSPGFPGSIDSLVPIVGQQALAEAYGSSLHAIHRKLERKMKEKGFPGKTYDGFGLAVDEALTNAFKHGNLTDASKEIEYNELYLKGNFRHGYVVFIRDSGLAPFMHDQTYIDLFDPKTGQPSLLTHGRGFFLMQHFSTQLFVIPDMAGNNLYLEIFRSLPNGNGTTPANLAKNLNQGDGGNNKNENAKKLETAGQG